MKTMKKIALLTALFFLLTGTGFAADQTIASTEEMVGSGHATKTDTLNRLGLVEHNTDGTHKAAITGLSVTAGKTITATQNTTLDEAVAMSSKASLATPSFTTGIGVGAASAGTGGIAFPATAVAVANANTLDDYEEGTWTPDAYGITGETYTAQLGYYTRIGNIVIVTGQIVFSGKGTGNCNSISGLPFAVATTAAAYSAPSFTFAVIPFTGQAVAYGGINTDRVSFEQVSEAGTRSALTINANNTSDITVTLVYRAQ